MTTIEIIPGMTEVMDYIKKQDEEIKKLKNDLRLCAEGLIPSDLIQRGIVETCRGKVKELEEENKKLREEIERDSGCEENAKLRKENEKLKEHLECEEDGYPTSDWFADKLDFHIKYHFTNEGGEYYENLKDLKEKPNCLDDLIYGSLERLQEEFKEKEETFKYQSDMEKQCHNDDIDKKQQVIDELKDENEELHKTINTMACSAAATDFCMEHWIIHEQIDPKLLLGNWEEFYVKDENGKWIKKPKTD